MKPIAEKYFNDYKMTEVINEKGNGTIKKLKYYGDYYLHDISDKNWKLQKKVFFILVLLISIIFLFGLTIDAAGSYVNYVAAPPLLFIIPLLLLFMGSIKNIFTNRRMSRNEYNESVSFMRLGLILGMIVNLSVVILEIIFISKNGASSGKISDLYVMLSYIVNFFIMISMFLILHKIKFIKEKAKWKITPPL